MNFARFKALSILASAPGRQILAGFAGLLVLAGGGVASAQPDNLFGPLGSIVRWYHLYSADDGKSHIVEMPVPVSQGPNGSMSIFDRPVSRVSISSYPDGIQSDWHYAIHTHVLVYLQGSQIIDLGDGKEYKLEPGVAVLADDWAGRGHRYRCEAKTGAHACVAIDIIVGDIDKHLPLPPPPPASPAP